MSGHSGCAIPGIRSTILPVLYGSILHSRDPVRVPAVVPKFQFTQNQRSPGVVCILFVKSVPLVIRVRTVFHPSASCAVHRAPER